VFDGGHARTLLTETDGELPLPTTRCPAWFYGNAGGAGYYRVVMSRDAAAALIGRGWNGLDVAERMSLTGDVAAMVRAGDLDLGVALDLVARLVADNVPRELVSAAVLAHLPLRFLSDRQRRAYDAWLLRTFDARAR